MGNLSPMRPIRRIFVSKDAISHFLKLVDLVFQQAAIVIGNGAKPSISGFGVYWRVKAEME